MSKPYDASGKHLIEAFLPDWFALCDQYVEAPVETIDADVSSVTAAADKVIKVHSESPWLLHVEWQSHRDDELTARANLYNTLLNARHRLLVHSMLVVLHRGAWSPAFTGEWALGFAGRAPYKIFRYQVVRVWELPLERLLQGPLGLLALAPLTDEAKDKLPEVIGAIEYRVDAAPIDRGQAGAFWTAIEILMGLRYDSEEIQQLCRRVVTMQESSVYQAILAEGFKKGEQLGVQQGVARGKTLGSLRILRDLGTDRLGVPAPEVWTRIEAIEDPEQLAQLCRRVLHIQKWEDLLDA